jgi:type II secretory pathway pseudopilin PulG
MTKPHRTKVAGFTIVELLIAATLTVLIVVMLGTMFGSLTKTTSGANQRIDAFREARAALHMIEKDFSGVVTAKPTAYFAIENDASTGSGSEARHLYGLISTKNSPAAGGAAGTGDMCAVGYYCGWQAYTDPATGQQFGEYRILRYFRDSVATFGLVKNAGAYGSMSALYKTQLSGIDEVLATNCWNLMVTAYDSAGNIIIPKPHLGGETTTAPYVCNPSASTTTLLPAAIEVSFKAMSRDAARTAIANGAIPEVWMAMDERGASQSNIEKYKRLIAPHVYQFRTRIKL